MTALGNMNKIWKSALGATLLSASFISANAQTPPPYLLPYTINSILGGGSKPTVGASCPGPNGAKALDTLGDGCLATSSSVITNTDVHDVGVDPEGNVYFIDNGSTGTIRRIDARSGVVNIYAGSVTNSAVCATTIDKYGDNCTANDGAANTNSKNGFTGALTKGRGLAVAKNGDVYFADYNGNLIHKISASTGVMTIVAGYLSGTAGKGNSAGAGYTGDGGPATSAAEGNARGVTADTAGNIYFADSGNEVVRKVNTAGIVSTIAGKYLGTINTTAPFSGDSGPATAANLNTPEDVEVDANGNLFIADFGNSRVRVIYAGGAQVAALIAATGGGAVAVPGNIYTVMGGATATYSPGSVVLATSVAVAGVRKIALDARGNIYVADNTNSVIWYEDGTTGYMRVIAGTFGATSGGAGCAGQANTVGDNCQATSATLNPNSAMGVGVDAQGNVYISDSLNARIRKVSVNQNFPTVTSGSSVTQALVVHFAVGDTPAATAAFTITGSADFVVTPPASCPLNPDNTTDCTITVTFSPTHPGQDLATLVVKSSLGTTSQFGLSGIGGAASVALDPGTATSIGTGYKSPAGIALDSTGNAYVADTGNNVIIRYDITGAGTVIAGITGTAGNSGNGGPAADATLSAPSAVAVTPDGAIYIADTGNNVVRRIDPATGVIAAAAGGATTICPAALDALGNGCAGTQAKLSAPTGLASDSRGNVYISDTGNNVIRELTTAGYIFAIGGPVFSAPTALQVDSNSNIFVADTGHNNIAEISSAGAVSVVAGNGQNGSSGNGGAATAASLGAPTGLALDAAGDLYIADTGNHVIRMVNAAGIINTVAGTLGQSGAGILPGSVNTLLLKLPGGVAATTTGKLYFLDSGNNRAYTLDRTSVTESLGSASPNTSSPVQTIQQTNTGSLATLLSPSSSQPIFTATGDSTAFSITPQGSLGCSGGQNLTPGATCFLGAQFNPAALGNFSATFTEANLTPAPSTSPSIQLSGVGAILVSTNSATVLTSPATGNPQFSVPFTVTTTVTPVSCNATAPSCVPTGTVQFFVGTTPVGIPVALNSAGAASTSISGQNVGPLTVTAVYGGDLYYGSSTAPPLSVTVTTGTANVAVSLSAPSLPQFQPLTITAKASASSGGIPTGIVTFFADGNPIGSATLNAAGIASISDPQLTDSKGNAITPVPSANSFGLFAGAHAITAAYAGDTNYTKTTSPAATLTIQPDAATFTSYFISPTTLAPVAALSAGTAQGSTALATVMIVPSNTLNGTVTFTCSGLPANSVCTVTPTSLAFTPVPGSPSAQTVGVTLWTDVAPGVVPTSTSSQATRPNLSRHPNSALAAFLGWPLLLTSFVGVLGFHKRLKQARLLAVLVWCGLLFGGSMVISGCSGGGTSTGGTGSPSLTPTGKFNVTLTVSGPNNTTQTMPIQFTVAPGVAGQE
jgi:sugar lactone lactonase YvrE